MAKARFGPIDSKPTKAKPFAVFDIEAKPAFAGEPLNTAFLGGGIFDGQSYRDFLDLDSLCAALLSPDYEGWWIYAHNGSGYDFHFLFDYLCRKGLDFEAFKTGERFFLATHKREFLDSMAILRGGLASVAEGLGLKNRKWSVPPDFYRNIEKYDWRGYLKDDCLTLYEAILSIRESCEVLGCNLKPTLASTAMDLFRRVYLDQTITPVRYGRLEDKIREAYVGGRVEVFQERMRGGASFDINSSYPHQMLSDVPTDCIGAFQNSIPDFGVVDATIVVPPDDYIPPIHFVWDGILYFPTGERRQWVTAQEARFIRERYGSSAINAHGCIAYNHAPIFKRYVEDLYETRMRAQRGGKPALAIACKYLLNSLYGKTGMKRERMKIVKGRKWRDWPWNDPVAYERLRTLRARATKQLKRKTVLKEVISHEHGIFGIPHYVNNAPYILPAIAATITAGGRLSLQKYLDVAGENAVYCDTDSVFVSGKKNAAAFDDFCGESLGQIKREKEIESGWFPFPKCYLLQLKDGSEVGKAKGLKRKSIEQVKNFLAGERVEVPRMLGIMEKLRRTGDTAPRSEWSPKKVANSSRKRHPSGRPYSVEEIKWLSGPIG